MAAPEILSPRCNWPLLSHKTLGVLPANLNTARLIIARPVTSRGPEVEPLAPESFDYLIWSLMGYLFAADLQPAAISARRARHPLISAATCGGSYRTFFPHLISQPFHGGLSVVFGFAFIMCLIAALASWLCGGGYAYHQVKHAMHSTLPPNE